MKNWNMSGATTAPHAADWNTSNIASEKENSRETRRLLRFIDSLLQ